MIPPTHNNADKALRMALELCGIVDNWDLQIYNAAQTHRPRELASLRGWAQRTVDGWLEVEEVEEGEHPVDDRGHAPTCQATALGSISPCNCGADDPKTETGLTKAN